MKKYITYSIIALVVFLSSCQQEGINPVGATVQLNVELINQAGGGATNYGIWIDGEQMFYKTVFSRQMGYIGYKKAPLPTNLLEVTVFEVDESRVRLNNDTLFNQNIELDLDVETALNLNIQFLKLIKPFGSSIQVLTDELADKLKKITIVNLLPLSHQVSFANSIMGKGYLEDIPLLIPEGKTDLIDFFRLLDQNGTELSKTPKMIRGGDKYFLTYTNNKLNIDTDPRATLAEYMGDVPADSCKMLLSFVPTGTLFKDMNKLVISFYTEELDYSEQDITATPYKSITINANDLSEVFTLSENTKSARMYKEDGTPIPAEVLYEVSGDKNYWNLKLVTYYGLQSGKIYSSIISGYDNNSVQRGGNGATIDRVLSLN